MPSTGERLLEAIRKRPGMYIGDPDDRSGLHNLLWEIIANSVDDHLAGHCRRVEVVIEADDSVSVRDDGCGIPIDLDEDGRRFAERVVTEMHRSPNRDGHTPHTHVGSIGVGLCVVNALSETFELEIERDGGRWSQRYARGVAQTDFLRLGPSDRSGTRIRFRPDPQVFPSIDLDYQPVRERLDELARLSRGLVFDLRDERRRHDSLQGTEGLGSLLPGARQWRRPLGDEIHVAESVGDTRVEAILGWDTAEHEAYATSFVNMQRTRGGGSHVTGLLAGLAIALQKAALPRRVPRAYARRRSALGLCAVIHVVVCHDVRFITPVMDRLAAPDIEDLVRDLVAREVKEALTRRPEVLRALLAQLPSEAPAVGATRKSSAKRSKKKGRNPPRRRRRSVNRGA